jgi:hypothetical protein
MRPLAILALLLPALSLAQDGSVSGPTSSSQAAGYSCDASVCKLPKCNCASASPPGGLSPVNTRSFAMPSYLLPPNLLGPPLAQNPIAILLQFLCYPSF